MNRFSNIIYISESDESDTAALKQAVDLAQTNQSQLTIIGYLDNLRNLDQNQHDNKILVQELV